MYRSSSDSAVIEASCSRVATGRCHSRPKRASLDATHACQAGFTSASWVRMAALFSAWSKARSSTLGAVTIRCMSWNSVSRSSRLAVPSKPSVLSPIRAPSEAALSLRKRSICDLVRSPNPLPATASTALGDRARAPGSRVDHPPRALARRFTVASTSSEYTNTTFAPLANTHSWPSRTPVGPLATGSTGSGSGSNSSMPCSTGGGSLRGTAASKAASRSAVVGTLAGSGPTAITNGADRSISHR